MEVLNRIIAAAPAMLLATIALIGALSRNVIWYALLFTIITSGLLNQFLKIISARLVPALSDRPSGCGGLKCMGCSIFPRGVSSPLRGRGMPSGHVQTVAAALGFALVSYPLRGAAPLFAGMVALVGMQRVISKCHSATQVLFGGIIGVGWGSGLGFVVASSEPWV